MMLSSNWVVSPSESTCESIFSAITFAVYSFTVPSSNLTSYMMELFVGLWLYFPDTFSIRSQCSTLDHTFRHSFIKLQLDFGIDQSVVDWCLIQQSTVEVDGIFYLWSWPCWFLIIFVRIKSFRIFRNGCLRRVYGVPISPLDQSVKGLLLGLLCGTRFFSGMQSAHGMLCDHSSIGFQYPLSHFVTLTACRAQNLSKYLLVMGKSSGVLTEITPLVPLELTDV